MKLTTFFFLISILSVAARGYSQHTRLNLSLHDASIQDLFQEIENQSEFNFFYKDDQIDVNKMVSIEADNSLIGEVLNEIFENSDVSYTVVNKVIVITPKKEQQNIEVTGTVTASTGETLPGVTIVVKGTEKGTITGMDGKYSIDVPDANSVLVFSYVGFKTQEVNINDRSVIDVILEEGFEALDEIVVIGYGTQKKVNLTGAVSSVKMDEVLGYRPVNTIAAALQGSVPGLQLTQNSGSPGEGFSFNIRGITSINGGSPLILVDNVPMDISMLDPNDIESVSVLKDASSTSIYGSRAAFGVVLITTKKADYNKKFSVNYSNNFAFSTPESLPKKASIRETLRVSEILGQTEGLTHYFANMELGIWEAELDKYEANPSLFPNGLSEVDGILYSLREYDEFEDMMDAAGVRQQHNISITGGLDKISYRLGLGRVDEDGILVTDKDSYVRDNISAYVKSEVNDWFTAEIDLRFSNSTTTKPVSKTTGSGYGVWGFAVIHPSHAPLGYGEVMGETIPYQTSRNIIELDGTSTKRKDNLRLFGKTTMTPFKGFTLVSEWTYNYIGQKDRNYEKVYQIMSSRNFQPQFSRDNSLLSLTNRLSDDKAVNIYGTYEYSISDLNMSIMAGFNQETSDYSYLWVKGTEMMNNELPSISSAVGDPLQSDSYSEFATRGYFFRANFSYADKYLLEINGRYDGSSKFPENNRFGFFPSVSAGWRISEEAFMESIKPVVSNLKLRASYGSIGNQSISNYTFIPSMNAYETHWMVDGMDMKSIYPPSLVSSSFTWEKVRTADLGLDLGLLSNKFSMGFDVYQRETIGMLANAMELPAVLGASAPQQNVADLMAYGWELQVNWKESIGNDFRYNLGFNLYDSKTKITRFDNEAGLLNNYREGQILGDIWGYTTDRFYTEDDFDASGNVKEGIAYLQGANHLPGDIVYVDYDGDYKIDNGDNTEENPGDMKIIGNNKRRYQYGITAGLGWKNFDLSLYLTGVGKRDLWLTGMLIFPHDQEFGTIYADQMDYWTPENTDAFHAIPRYSKSYNKLVQTKYLKDGSYIRLRNISLSYRLPKEIISKVGFNEAKLFVSGENLWTMHHLPEGMDPEMSTSQNWGGWTYPFMKKVSFGINVTF